MREQATVLEEGQSFLLQKHRQVVAEYHQRLRRAREEATEAGERVREVERQGEQKERELKTELEKCRREGGSSRDAEVEAVRTEAQAEASQLVGVVEDLQRAMDEKNEVLDLMQQHLRNAEEALARHNVQQQQAHGGEVHDRVGELQADLEALRRQVYAKGASTPAGLHEPTSRPAPCVGDALSREAPAAPEPSPRPASPVGMSPAALLHQMRSRSIPGVGIVSPRPHSPPLSPPRPHHSTGAHIAA
eukprot:Hpha_TRINITY_DN9813_c0_g2::TRINITY_DN9813_c0_g2_i2::g.81566::m.81566